MCQEERDGLRCEREAGHDGMHRAEHRTWGFRSNEPEWVRRMKARELPAKELVR